MSTLSPADSATVQAALIKRMRKDPNYANEIMAQILPTLKAPNQSENDVMIVDIPYSPLVNPPTEGEGGGN